MSEIGLTLSKRTDIATYDLTKPDSIELVKSLLKHYITDVKGGIKTIDEGMILLLRAKELNFPFSTCVEHIHLVNGKTGIDVHVAKALLTRAGVVHTWIRRYTPLYEYTDGFSAFTETKIPDYYKRANTKGEAKEFIDRGEPTVYPVICFADVNNNVYKSYQLNAVPAGTFVIVPNPQLAAQHIAGKNTGVPIFRVPNQPIDFISEIEFKRMLLYHDKWIERTATYKFTMTEAVQAGLTDKDNWIKYPQIMLDNRTYILGARDIADDVLQGVLSNQELDEIVNTPVPITDAEIID
jgi:hypothetical protein